MNSAPPWVKEVLISVQLKILLLQKKEEEKEKIKAQMSCAEQPCPYHRSGDSPSSWQRLLETEKQRPWQSWKPCRSTEGSFGLRGNSLLALHKHTKVWDVEFHFLNKQWFQKYSNWVFHNSRTRRPKSTAAQESPFVLFHRHHKITTESYCSLHTERDVVSDGFVFTTAKWSYYFWNCFPL